MAVIGFAGFGMFKADHGRDGKRALKVRIVEAFHVFGQGFQAQIALQGFQNAAAVAFGVFDRELAEFFFAVVADVRKWTPVMSPYLTNLQEYYTWTDSILPLCGKTTGIPIKKEESKHEGAKIIATKGGIVFTGFRDSDLEAKCVAAGWEIQDSIKKTTKALVVADLSKKSSKIVAAEKAGIQILLRTSVESLF